MKQPAIRPSTPDYSDEALVERAVRNSKPGPAKPTVPRFHCVMHTFACGSTVAHSLCRRYGLDPNENLTGRFE